MKIMLLTLSVLLLSSCAANPPPSLSVNRPLPEAVTKPPSASVEGTSTESLTTLHYNMQKDLERSLQQFHNDILLRLRTSLESLKPSPLVTEGAKPLQ